MKDEALVHSLYAKCEAELKELDTLGKQMREYSHETFQKNAKTLYGYRMRVLLIMERLANGEHSPEGKTSWDHVNEDES